MSNIELRKVEPDTIGQIWTRIQPMMKSAYETSNGRLSAESTFKLVLSGNIYMWILYCQEEDRIYGILGASVVEYPTDKKFLCLHFMVGVDRKKWIHLVENVEQYAKDKGCAGIEMWCRKGWQKELPDYHMSHVLLEKDL